jgi:hypothetical protein
MSAHGNSRRPIFICGGDYERLAPRGDCPDPLHDWPLPAGYNEAHDAARNRLGRGWSQARCPHCHLYGWRPGVMKDRDGHVPAPGLAAPELELADDYERNDHT